MIRLRTSTKLDIKQYLDIEKQELLVNELQLIDHNDMIYIYKKECKVPEYHTYLTQYYFRKKEKGKEKLLTVDNLLKSYKNSSCFMALQLFLDTENIIQLNEYGHLKLFDIINSHAATKAYELLQCETFLFRFG